MKLLFTQNHADMGGVEVYNLELGRRLIERGHEVTIATGPGELVELYQEAGIAVKLLQPKSAIDIGYIARLRRFILDEQFDVVQVNMLKSIANGLIAAKLGRAPVIANMHSAIIDWDIHPIKKMFDITVNTTLSNLLANKVIAISQTVKRQITAQEFISHNKVVVVYNGVDTKKFCVSKNNKLRDRLGLGQDVFVVGFMGRLSVEKGVRDFIPMAKAIQGQTLPMVLVIGGNGNEYDYLAGEVKKNGLEKVIYLLGYVDPNSRAEIYNGFDAFAFLSNREGFGLTLVEAMACGLPVVAYDLPVVRELVTEGSGFIVEQNNVAGIIAQLNELISNPELKNKTVKLARKRAEEFSEEAFVNNMDKLYLSLAEKY